MRIESVSFFSLGYNYPTFQANWSRATFMKLHTARLLSLATLLFSGVVCASPPQLGEWQLLFPNDDGRAVAIDVYRETPVILDSKGQIFFLNKEIGKESTGEWFGEVYENWQKVSGGGEASDISIDGDGIPWVVGLNSKKIYHLDGDFAGQNRGWVEHPGNGRGSRISVSKATGIPYMIGARSGYIYQGSDKGWTRLPIKLLDSKGEEINRPLNAMDLYAESDNAGDTSATGWHDHVYTVTRDKRVYLYQPDKQAWQELPGNARAEAIVTSGKLVYIIGDDKKFYGLNLPGDKEWSIAGTGTGKDLAFSQVDIFQPFITQGGKKVPSSSYRYVWTINESGQVLRAFVAYQPLTHH